MSQTLPPFPAARLPWPAMVLTAGLGTRLAPLTSLKAKPALPVAGVPLAVRILRWLAGGGVTDAVLNLHHRPESITAAVGDGTAFGVRVRYSWEPRILGSAGGPARALPLLDSDQFFLVNGDTLTDLDITALLTSHRESGALVTLAVVPNPDPLHYGGVSVDREGRVTGFTAPGPGNLGWHFIGVQAVNASVFARLNPDEPATTVSGIYREMTASRPGAIRAMMTAAAFFDIGTAADYLDTCLTIGRTECMGDVIAGARVRLDPGARVARSVLWDDVVVAGGAALNECVVADGVHVPAGLRLSRRVIMPRGDLVPGGSSACHGDLLLSPLDAKRLSVHGRIGSDG